MKSLTKLNDMLNTVRYRARRAWELPEGYGYPLDLYIRMHAIGLQRARSAKGDSTPRTPIKSRKWIACVGQIIAEQMRDNEEKTIDYPVSGTILIGYHKGRRPDMDNMEKAIWDACHRGDESGKFRALEDDRLVRGYVEVAEIVVPKNQEEFIWIRLAALPED